MKRILSTIALTGLFLIQTNPVFAWSSDPNDPNAITVVPNFEILQAVGFENVYQENDLLLITRFNLYEDEPSNTNNWCLITESDCTSTPIKADKLTITADEFTDKFPISLQWKSTVNNQSTLMIDEPLNRISYAMDKIYISNQSLYPVTYGDPNSELCLQPNHDIFLTLPNGDCRNIIWKGSFDVGTGDYNSSKQPLVNHVIDELLNLTEELNHPENYFITSNGKITYEGIDFVKMAVGNDELIFKDFYSISVSDVTTGTPQPYSSSALETTLQGEYNSSTLKSSVDGVMKYHFNISGSWFWHFMFLFFGFISAGFFFLRTGNGFLSLFSGISIYMISIFVVPSNIAIILSILALGSLIATGVVLRRLGV
tara:strand:+ start:426 stop:1535 length:1110 start_codon:yes stop_codon:yes gene_type:complete